MSKSKNVYAHKWDVSILEQIAESCNIASNARTVDDWRLFLQTIYEGICVLEYKQRLVLLLSQEVGLSLVDIGRILNMPVPTVALMLTKAVDKLVMLLKSRSLTKKGKFASKAMQLIYSERAELEDCNNATTNFEFFDKYVEPWFYPVNYLALVEDEFD